MVTGKGTFLLEFRGSAHDSFAVGYTNYQVSFVKRLVGSTQGVGSVDFIARLKAVAVNLDFHYGLLHMEYAIQHSK